jgi:hypothetical protein
VKRYDIGSYDEGLIVEPDGEYVLYSDHLEEVRVLREALREALEGWRDKKTLTDLQFTRIQELRKLLGDI